MPIINTNQHEERQEHQEIRMVKERPRKTNKNENQSIDREEQIQPQLRSETQGRRHYGETNSH